MIDASFWASIPGAVKRKPWHIFVVIYRYGVWSVWKENIMDSFDTSNMVLIVCQTNENS